MSRKHVTASDIGSCQYCAYQLYLRRNLGDSEATTAKLLNGVKVHDHYNTRHRTSSNAWTLLLALALVAVFLIVKSL